MLFLVTFFGDLRQLYTYCILFLFYSPSGFANGPVQTNGILNNTFLGIGVPAITIILASVFYYLYIKKYKQDDLNFRKLVENANDIIFTTDFKGNFNFVNNATIEFSGYKKEELLGKSGKIFVREDYKSHIEEFYINKIKNKVTASYKELPFVTKSGVTVWVGQWVTFKYDSNQTFAGTEVICRNVTERILAEEKLKSHNKDLRVINRVKEIILTSNETSNMYVEILLLLGAHSDKSNFFSINIIDKFNPVLHTYSLNTKDQSVKNLGNRIEKKYADSLQLIVQTIFDFEIDKNEAILLKHLHQPTDIYKSAVVVPIFGNNKLFGFIGFYSLQKNAYPEDHSIMVKDVATSLCSYFVQYEQRQLIKDYSHQLEILNESKSRLISCTDLNDVYKEIINLLYQEIKNVYRVSILVHDLEKNIGNIIFKDNKSHDIGSKIISTKTAPTIPYHVDGKIFEKLDLDNDSDLTEEDKLWKSKGIKSIISLPIHVNGSLFASVNLLSEVPFNFNDQQKALIKEINESAAYVIEQIKFKEIISEKNKDISDNINYARRIQNALMPSEDLLHVFMPNSFLLFNQRDSLGGDFYWYDKLGDNIFMAVGDCTGHGVSGSLLTILASDYIKQAVEVKKFTDPGLILEHLRDSMHATLNKYSDDEIVDGLDISFGVYNPETNTFLYSSAMHYFYLIRNNELMEYKGNRKPIGGSAALENSYFFTTHLFQLQKNDMVYFTTDGYIDQLQQKTEKRFGKTRFKQLLLLISDLNPNEQKKVLLEQHLKWKGNINQTDDICLLGFKV